MESTTLEKLEKAAPYNILCNIIPESSETSQQPNAINFRDLLCPSLGKLKSSLQINFIIGVEWLMQQYESQNLATTPLTLLYGDQLSEESEKYLETFPNVSHEYVEIKGCHHAKIGIYVYEDSSLRVVVSTANLYQKEWEYANQQLWVSPLCRSLPETAPDTSGDSATNFKSALLEYLQSYKLDIVQPWISYVTRADFSDVKVFLVTSIPGQYTPPSTRCHLHYVGDLLAQHCTLPDGDATSWPIIAQMSSVGFYGKSPAEWLRGTFLRNIAAHDRSKQVYLSSAPLKIVYPSLRNVRDSYLSKNGGFCLNYDIEMSNKQDWLRNYLHHWKADELGRSRVMPHDKFYCRISPCLTKLAWFLLSSANMSRGAWGSKYLDENRNVFVRNYEAGVMFFPKFFDEEYFKVGGKGGPGFPMVCDLPLTEYEKRDRPFCDMY
ncbi:hypothetical protein Zmor_016779 [Zophobas morio]|uniref:Tyrosyl-DNA phosphodiesterase n=1 Tax=Zophobas morio TaxID=2755281 RepID=A0AA38IB16_9CUCU|nr:hypothetical protein Zmor_016779 [Zophobas morio]